MHAKQRSEVSLLQQTAYQLLGGDLYWATHVPANEDDDPHDRLHDVLVLVAVRLRQGPEEARQQRLQLRRQLGDREPRLPAVLPYHIWGVSTFHDTPRKLVPTLSMAAWPERSGKASAGNAYGPCIVC